MKLTTKHVLYIWLTCIILLAIGAVSTTSVMVNSSTKALVNPTNFFVANSNLLNQSIPASGGGSGNFSTNVSGQGLFIGRISVPSVSLSSSDVNPVTLNYVDNGVNFGYGILANGTTGFIFDNVTGDMIPVTIADIGSSFLPVGSIFVNKLTIGTNLILNGSSTLTLLSTNNGSSLTNLNASSLASGTIITNRLPSNLPDWSKVSTNRLANVDKIQFGVAASDETTAITASAGKVTFRMPCAMTVTDVRASLTTAQSSGSIFTVDINDSGTTILSTKLTIDNTEKTSTTAATPPVISDTALADDAEITIDIDQIGDGTAKGIKIWIIGVRP